MNTEKINNLIYETQQIISDAQNTAELMTAETNLTEEYYLMRVSGVFGLISKALGGAYSKLYELETELERADDPPAK